MMFTEKDRTELVQMKQMLGELAASLNDMKRKKITDPTELTQIKRGFEELGTMLNDLLTELRQLRNTLQRK